jgi:hypothetical protein
MNELQINVLLNKKSLERSHLRNACVSEPNDTSDCRRGSGSPIGEGDRATIH